MTAGGIGVGGHDGEEREGAPHRRRRTLSDVERVLGRVLELAADHLDMEVAWVSEIGGDAYRLRAVRGDAEAFGVQEGLELPLDATYCARMLGGALPSAVPDLAADPRTAQLAPTTELGFGAYLGVPIRFVDGEVYGTLCCLSANAAPALDGRDVKFLELLASVAGEELHREHAAFEERRERRVRIEAALHGERLRVAYQPIVDVATRRTVAVEALARFAGGPASPATWFADAAAVGLGEELELAAVRAALAGLDDLPPDVRLSVNASPRTAASPRLAELLDGPVTARVQLELTEQSPVDDYDALLAALAVLRARGVVIAVDDAGAGYADLRHILRVAPDVIKLDMALSRDIDTDPARAALASSLVQFAGRVDARLVAEGVETASELATLAGLGVGLVQGHLLAPPGPLAAL